MLDNGETGGTSTDNSVRKVEEEDHREIKRLADEGLTEPEICARTNWKLSTVQKWKRMPLSYWDDPTTRPSEIPKSRQPSYSIQTVDWLEYWVKLCEFARVGPMFKVAGYMISRVDFNQRPDLIIYYLQRYKAPTVAIDTVLEYHFQVPPEVLADNLRNPNLLSYREIGSSPSPTGQSFQPYPSGVDENGGNSSNISDPGEFMDSIEKKEMLRLEKEIERMELTDRRNDIIRRRKEERSSYNQDNGTGPQGWGPPQGGPPMHYSREFRLDEDGNVDPSHIKEDWEPIGWNGGGNGGGQMTPDQVMEAIKLGMEAKGDNKEDLKLKETLEGLYGEIEGLKGQLQDDRFNALRAEYDAKIDGVNNQNTKTVEQEDREFEREMVRERVGLEHGFFKHMEDTKEQVKDLFFTLADGAAKQVFDKKKVKVKQQQQGQQQPPGPQGQGYSRTFDDQQYRQMQIDDMRKAQLDEDLHGAMTNQDYSQPPVPPSYQGGQYGVPQGTPQNDPNQYPSM